MKKDLVLKPLNYSPKRQFNYLEVTKPENQTRHQIQIDYVQGVKEPDFKQAQRTWQKLEEAGLDPGELVAWGLSFGHGYDIKNLTVPPQRFREIKGLMSESVITEEVIVGYSLTQKLLKSGLDEGALVPLDQLIKVGDDLVVLDQEEEKVVKITAVFKQQPTNALQLEEAISEEV